jgi:tetratricopeptide (TPR) repeat protein
MDDNLSARDYYTRGLTRYLENDVEEAIADFTQAIRLDPQFAHAYVRRGVAYGNTPEALADFTEAIRLDPEYIQAYYNRGFLRAAVGDYPGAIADFRRVLQLRPDHPQAHNIRLDIAEWLKK